MIVNKDFSLSTNVFIGSSEKVWYLCGTRDGESYKAMHAIDTWRSGTETIECTRFKLQELEIKGKIYGIPERQKSRAGRPENRQSVLETTIKARTR